MATNIRKILQISIEVNSGSVGRIAEQIGDCAMQNGWESYITYARNHQPSSSKTIRIGNKLDVYWHGVMTRLFDTHCLHSTGATRRLVKQIDEIKPDIILMHHIHGYFLDMRVLFDYLSRLDTPVVWIFHDCWAFTGHCAHFASFGCERWKTGCYDCPAKGQYPASMWLDRSRKNYIEKRSLFNSLRNLVIVPVSEWMSSLVKESFLGRQRICTITNGVDIELFTPRDEQGIARTRNRLGITFLDKIILGVASSWNDNKGLRDFELLSSRIPHDWRIVLVGLTEQQIKELPKGIIGIHRTESVEQLADLYAAADVYVNLTYADTYPTTNLEAIACGTPVITYRTGGSPESVTEHTGIVVEQGDLNGVIAAISKIAKCDREALCRRCRTYAENHFDRRDRFTDYIKLFKKLMLIKQ